MKPLNNLLGQSFGRLTVTSRATNPGTRKNDTAAYWNCLCQCGKTAIIRGYSLTTGKTQSCGCLKLEAPHLVQFQIPKYPSKEMAARSAWRSRYDDLPFQLFCELAQQPCIYCGTTSCLQRESRRVDSEIFQYNSLDRIDSSLGYTPDNVVPACLICNRAKLDRTLVDFRQYINELICNTRLSPEKYRELSTSIDLSPINDPKNYSYLTSLKATQYRYSDGNITIDQFYQLTQMRCYYCTALPSNRCNINGKRSSVYARRCGFYVYSGLDRIDNNLPHNYDNVVPSCKYCNSAKQQLTLEEFDQWIQRLQAHSKIFDSMV